MKKLILILMLTLAACGDDTSGTVDNPTEAEGTETLVRGQWVQFEGRRYLCLDNYRGLWCEAQK